MKRNITVSKISDIWDQLDFSQVDDFCECFKQFIEFNLQLKKEIKKGYKNFCGLSLQETFFWCDDKKNELSELTINIK